MTRRQGRASIAAKLVMAASFLNSLAVTLPAVAIPVVIAGTAAYAFTFLEFPGRDLLFGLIVGLLIVPNQVALARCCASTATASRPGPTRPST